jgi:hypothetical protein
MAGPSNSDGVSYGENAARAHPPLALAAPGLLAGTQGHVCRRGAFFAALVIVHVIVMQFLSSESSEIQLCLLLLP